VVGITNDAFLLARADADTSPTVRAATVRTLQNAPSLLTAVRQACYRDVRQAALDRLVNFGDADALEQARHAQQEIVRQVGQLPSVTDSMKLVEGALHGSWDVLRQAAAERLTNPSDLKRVALASTDREVLKRLLPKLQNDASLDEIASSSADPAMRLAATRKARKASWVSIFQAAGGRDGSVTALGDALAAVALFGEVQNDAKENVEQTCLKLIRCGDESRIPEMVDLLALYHGTNLTENYLNCGQPDLNKAARALALKHGP
jgi:hypothetical protein